jgi:Holliday junction resolvase
MATEKTLQAYFVKKLKDMGGISYKFDSSSRRGVPDLICIYKASVFFVEVKNPKGTGRLTPLQKHEISKLRLNGATVYVLDSYNAAADILELVRLERESEGRG